ncbi:MAG: DUF1467 family protein [Alphaproteobacteria bacterium]|nr:DUF1467 family protein [Alphaproteobacteria bacterium]
MSLLDAAFIYVMLWWLCLFTVLPLGVKRHTEEGKGHDMGAPVFPNLKKKLLINTVLAGVVLGVLWLLVYTGVINWHGWFYEGVLVQK